MDANLMVNILEEMLQDGSLKKSDLSRFTEIEEDETIPEVVRCKMERWYISLGIEDVIKRKLKLSAPYFTQDELKQIKENNEVLCCLPKGVTLSELCELFRCKLWINEDSLVSRHVEEEDLWFAAKIEKNPEYMDCMGREIQQIIKKNNLLNLTAERYIVLVNTLHVFCDMNIDDTYKTWIPMTRYEKKAMLIGGFDSNRKLSFQAWMPNFHTPYVGGRGIRICDHI